MGKKKKNLHRKPLRFRALAVLLAMCMIMNFTDSRILAENNEAGVTESVKGGAAKAAAKTAESETAKAAESEAAKAAESETAKTAESEAAKAAESETAKTAESETAKTAESEAAKAAESETAKTAESETAKAAEADPSEETQSETKDETLPEDEKASSAEEEETAESGTDESETGENETASDETEDALKESQTGEPENKAGLVLWAESVPAQEGDAFAKVKVHYELSGDCTLEAVETRLYIGGSNITCTQMASDGGTFQEQGHQYAWKQDGNSSYIECILNPGDHFTQEFKFSDSTAEPGSSVSFTVTLKTNGELPSTVNVQGTEILLSYTVPGQETETETVGETEEEAETEIGTEEETETGVGTEDGSETESETEEEAAGTYSWQELLATGPLLAQAIKAGEEVTEEMLEFYEQYRELLLGKGEELAARALLMGTEGFTEEELAIYQAYQAYVLNGGEGNGVATYDINIEGNYNGKEVLNTKGSNNENLHYLVSSEYVLTDENSHGTTTGEVWNSIKYVDEIVNKSPDSGERVAYCLSLDRGFDSDPNFNDVVWNESVLYKRLFSELAYAVSIGCKYYGKCNDSEYSTGNWEEDYYATQTLIYIIMYDYVNNKVPGLNLTSEEMDALGQKFSGHSLSSLKASGSFPTEGAAILEKVNEMYEAVKAYRATYGSNTNDDSYEAAMAITPSSVILRYNVDTNAYTGTFTITTVGTPYDDDGVSVSYSDGAGEYITESGNTYTVSIPAAYIKNKDTWSFTISASAKFKAQMTKAYICAVDTIQNITFFEEDESKQVERSASATVSVSAAKVNVKVVKTETGEESKPLSGAKFGIYSDSSCTDENKITEMQPTDADGTAQVSVNVGYGTVWIKEIEAPAGYELNDTAIEYVLTEQTNGDTVSHSASNDQTEISVSKKAVAGSEELPGAALCIKADDSEVASWTSGNEPHSVKGLVAGTEYTLCETSAPSGYVKADDITFELDVYGRVMIKNSDGDFVLQNGNTIVMSDEKTKLTITKVDEDGNPFSGATLKISTTENGSAYRLNNRSLVWETDGTPEEIEGLPHGTYYLIEVKAPDGYTTAKPVSFTIDGDSKDIQIVMKNKKTKVQFTKTFEKNEKDKDFTLERPITFGIYDGNGEDADKVAGFEITSSKTTATVYGLTAEKTYWLREEKVPEGFAEVKDLSFKVTDSLDADGNVIPVEVSITNKPTEIQVNKVDEEGKGLSGAVLQILKGDKETIAETAYGETLNSLTTTSEAITIKGLPCGTYYLHEVSAPDGYAIAEDVKFEVTEASAAAPVTVTMTDKLTEVKISKTKSGEDEDGNTVPVTLSGASLQILEGGSVVTTVEGCEWISKESAHVIKGLKINTTYTLHEVKAPDGYTLAADISFMIASDGTVKVDGEASADNTITMRDEQKVMRFAKVDTDGKYVANAKLEIRTAAGENLETPGELVYLDGEPLQWTTGDSYHEIKGMLPGTYYLVEAGAPGGYAKAAAEKFTVDQDPGVVTVTMTDCETLVKISKTLELPEGASDTLSPNNPAVFGIYKAAGNGLGELVRTVTITEADKVYEVTGLEAGNYILHEESAPAGYTLADDQPFTVTDEMISETVVKAAEVTVEEDLTEVVISKKDITHTGKELPGAALKVLDAETGEVAETVFGEKLSWVSGEDAKVIKGLPAGNYILREETAPAGFTVAEEIAFTVTDKGAVTVNGTDAEGNTVTMLDQTTGFSISKKDVAHTEKELPGAALKVIDAKTGEVAVTVYGEELSWTSGEEVKEIRGLPAGDYILREETAPRGFTVAEEIAFTLTEEGDVTINGTKAEDNKVTMLDKATETVISKVSITTEKELPGVALQILDENGEVAKTVYYVDEATTPDEKLEWISGEEAKVIRGLEAGRYTLHEVIAPDGYVTADDITFEVKSDGTVETVTMVDDITRVHISKKDFSSGEELTGARLILQDPEGNIVHDWVTDGTPEKLEGKLKAGETYTLTEITAPDGYDIAETVTFTVGEDGVIQTVVMEDKRSEGDGQITVHKYVKQDGKYIAVSYTFYVALFSDEAYTKRVSSVIPLEVKDSYSGTAVFKNLAYGVYYVAETDEYGNVITGDGLIVSNEIIDGEAALTPQAATAASMIINHMGDLPEGLYKAGEVTVNKRVLVNGASGKVTDTFYFALFVDEECTMMADTGVGTLKLQNASDGSVTFEGVPYGQYYLAETDASGTPVGNGYEYAVTIDQTTFELNDENQSVEITVTNAKEVETEETTSTTSVTTSVTKSVTGKTSAVKTGDDTPVSGYVGLMGMAALAAALALVFRRKRRFRGR